MLGTFSTSQGYFPKWKLPKCAISQAATFQVSSSRSARTAALGPPQPILAAALDPHCSLRRLRGPNLTFGKLPLRKLHTWEVATWDILPWEIAFGKVPNTIYN